MGGGGCSARLDMAKTIAKCTDATANRKKLDLTRVVATQVEESAKAPGQILSFFYSRRIERLISQTFPASSQFLDDIWIGLSFSPVIQLKQRLQNFEQLGYPLPGWFAGFGAGD